MCSSIKSRGLALMLDKDELDKTGGVILYVVQKARKCAHQTITLFEGWDQEYPAPKRCARCRHKIRTGHGADMVWEEVLLAAGMQ